jgi:hypothetical protein
MVAMCTLVLLQRPSQFLALSGNRNELLARPSSGPRIEGGVLAPRDDLLHGTWLGINRHGLFVCVTNRRGAMVDPSRRSRGLLVLEALQAQSARGLREALQELKADRHNGFHLVYADLRDAFVTVGDGASLQHLPLEPGQIHVITERSWGAGEGERERSVASDFAALPLDVHAWREPMRRHANEPLESACVHADAVGYGTRSSMQLILRGTSGEMLWTEGHPCTEEAKDLSPLLTSLFAG